MAAGADPSLSDNQQAFPLLIAINKKNIAIVKALVEAKVKGNAVIDRPGGGMALAVAACWGDKAIVNLLLDAGFDTSEISPDGHHPLTIASGEGHTEVVTMLLEYGADVNAVGIAGTTALTAGAQKGYRGIIEILLERGALGRGVGIR